ncbi:MAG TPA: hypothetical protein VN841_08685 [Bryobacteraceae bacterium]|nr:hypothetical protein [Bryobacteraceae bacterium]HYW46870.1 hypothetical protein [Bryobacteraceae bacterium]
MFRNTGLVVYFDPWRATTTIMNVSGFVGAPFDPGRGSPNSGKVSYWSVPLAPNTVPEAAETAGVFSPDGARVLQLAEVHNIASGFFNTGSSLAVKDAKTGRTVSSFPRRLLQRAGPAGPPSAAQWKQSPFSWQALSESTGPEHNRADRFSACESASVRC